MKPRSAAAIAHQVSEHCLVSRARLVARAITRIFTEELGPLDLAPPRFGLLVAISREGLASPTKLARQLGLEKSTLSRDLAALKALGFIEQRAGESGRNVAVLLTTSGRHKLKVGFAAWQRAQARTEELLGPAGAAALRHSARRIRAGD